MLSLRLKRRSGGALVGALLAATLTVVLAALMLALFPAVAEAQAEAQTKDKNPSSVVVQPGDSLWSISEERLGPNATPRRIVMGAEQIYALNRGLIGADPNLIFVGQELLVPPVMSWRSAGTTPAHKTAGKTTGAAEAGPAGPRARTAKGTTGSKATGKAPRTAPGGADARGGDVSAPLAERQAEPVILPDETAAAPVPSVRTLASNDSPPSPLAPVLSTVSSTVASAASVVVAVSEFFADAFADARPDERRLLGLGVLLLTLVVAALVAWRLPMRRTTREDAQRWGIPTGYYYGDSAAHRNNTPFASRPGSPGDLVPEEAGQEEAPVPLAPQQRGVPTGTGLTPAANGVHNASAAASEVAGRRVRKAKRKAKAKAKDKAKPRNGLALGVHNPGVRSASLLARAPARASARVPTRAQKPRPLRRAARPPRVSAPEQKRRGEPR